MKKIWMYSLILLSLGYLLILNNCDYDRLSDIEETQKEILRRIASIEENQKKILRFFQPRRPLIDYNKVYQIPIGKSPIRGNREAPVTIVEFSDFQCPYCAQAQSLIKRVLEAYPKEVKLVLKNYPLRIHKQARKAARAALAAKEQGKFWEMHDLLFQNYNRLSEEKFKEFALELGLDLERFMRDYRSERIDRLIEEDIVLARKVGVTGTPTFFINGRRMRRRSFASFKEAIDKILQRQMPSS